MYEGDIPGSFTEKNSQYGLTMLAQMRAGFDSACTIVLPLCKATFVRMYMLKMSQLQ